MAKMTIDEALARYGQECGIVTKTAILRDVRKYLEWGGTAKDESLKAYLAELTRQGYKPATVDLARRRVRAFWRALGVKPPRAVIQFDAKQDSERPALSADAMQTLLRAALRGQLEPHPAALMAISVVYGPRVHELAAIQPQDVDLRNRRLYLRVGKHGVSRWMWIPPLLEPLLDISWPDVSVAHAERQFGYIWSKVFGTEKPDGIAWHATRHGLVRDLRGAGIPDNAIGHFMRWARKGSADYAMVDLYADTTHTVDAHGKSPVQKPETGSYAEDARVWEKHPYLQPASP